MKNITTVLKKEPMRTEILSTIFLTSLQPKLNTQPALKKSFRKIIAKNNIYVEPRTEK